jgi:hypothetical protein
MIHPPLAAMPAAPNCSPAVHSPATPPVSLGAGGPSARVRTKLTFLSYKLTFLSTDTSTLSSSCTCPGTDKPFSRQADDHISHTQRRAGSDHRYSRGTAWLFYPKETACTGAHCSDVCSCVRTRDSQGRLVPDSMNCEGILACMAPSL